MSEFARPRPAAGGRFAQQTDQARAVAEKYAQQTDAAAEFPVAVLDELRTGGLLGLMVPTEYGGLGGTLDELLDVSIAMGRTDLSAALIFAMHCQQVACVVTHAAPPLAEELLPEIAAGRMYLASVTTEPGKGGHLLTAGAQLSADEAQSGHLELDRFAPIVTGGAYADGFLISMRAPEATSADAVSLVFARRDQLEITASGEWDPLGMRASHSVALRLTGSIPGHQVVGEHGEFRAVVLQTLGPLAHLGWSACWLGTAAGALSRVLRMLRESARGKDGKDGRLESELLLSRLSRARQRLDTVHALLRHTAAVVTAAGEGGTDVSLPRNQLLINSLKLTASEECHRAVEDLIDAVGLRHGYLRNSPTRLEKALRDLRSAPLNYSNDRLHQADGVLALLDAGVSFA
ncbi:acyl-CoA dehydrogenase family protein [Streptomyces sp. CBMA29]|uniref:acyl-CoA dehydrogenase family protein n=1 Tax=Streptomyces sp. CBMA29 TaxID=1896314 RepID=UPI001661EEC9|nr:acyl-CoA dehydrogenase family protein [Streptomyces sp. CBMA29]